MNKILPFFRLEYSAAIPQVVDLQTQIKKNPGAVKTINSLGVLYAKHDLLDKAEKQFQSILGMPEYVPALLNMGNVAVLRGDMEKGLEFCDRAQKPEAGIGQVKGTMVWDED